MSLFSGTASAPRGAAPMRGTNTGYRFGVLIRIPFPVSAPGIGTLLPSGAAVPQRSRSSRARLSAVTGVYGERSMDIDSLAGSAAGVSVPVGLPHLVLRLRLALRFRRCRQHDRCLRLAASRLVIVLPLYYAFALGLVLDEFQVMVPGSTPRLSCKNLRRSAVRCNIKPSCLGPIG